ncbi:MAG: protein phosphatase 2C domain-containing protein [Bryobacteraceae bacterium]
MAVSTKLNSAGLSDPGRKRENNEDCFHADAERGIFIVVDGVGGQAAGEKAAHTAVTLLRARLERQTGTLNDRIREAIAVANNEIFRLAQQNSEWRGMACVLTLAVVENGHVTVGHVGDCRLYVLQPGEIRKITHDHSPVGEREDRGEIGEDEAMRHPRRNEVFRDIGSEEHTPDDGDFIELVRIPFTPGSALLLCSDGLTDQVASQRILETVERHAGNPQSAARSLIRQANEAGGKDNVTVVVAEGSEYAQSVRGLALGSARRPAAAAPVPAKAAAKRSLAARILFSRAAFLLYGILLSLAAVATMKPYFKDLGDRTVVDFGAVREPKTWTVNPADLDAFGTISEALAASHPGDTILVAPGEYRETIEMAAGVRLVSEERHAAVLRGAPVAVKAQNVQGGALEGFRIASGSEQPTLVGMQVNNSAIRIVDSEISGTQEAAIEIAGDSTSLLMANRIVQNKGAGVVVRRPSRPTLLHNVIRKNGLEGVLEYPASSQNSFACQNFIGQNEMSKPRSARRKEKASFDCPGS